MMIVGAIVAEVEEVVVIAADLAGLDADAGVVEGAKRRLRLRKEPRLKLLCDLQLLKGATLGFALLGKDALPGFDFAPDFILKAIGGELPVSGEIEVGGTIAGCVENLRVFDARDAIGAEASGRERVEIPGAALGDEAERIDGALLENPLLRFAGLAGRSFAIDEGQLAVVRDGVLHDGQLGEIFGRIAPGNGIDVKAFPHGNGAVTHGVGQRREKLAEGAVGGGRETLISESAWLRHEKSAELGVIEAGNLRAPVFIELPASV